MEKSLRIRTNVGQDQVVHAKLHQDIDFLEILSLKIMQEDTYQLHTSNYGVIIGRVLANEGFGIPNAKISVFIPLDEYDEENSEITNIYPYKTLQDKNLNNIRYNLLPNSSNNECYKIVGTFPDKRKILDNNSVIEVYEKYWKYTTVTNNSGDYMIFGVPKGNHQIHVDIDLSDIGVLSQKPRDFLYKGYNIEQFDNASQFKDSTNLDSLTQLFTQNNSVYVYPFWGETEVEEIAITRCDIQIQYKFEPTCIFFGSIVSDDYSNSINHKCNPSKKTGLNQNLVTGEGTIEMIRKNLNGVIEEFPVQGNRLIDGNGVWCYQIPMNLDYIQTDEFGNIIPSDNPNKGIPTRTSVRFRISMQETENEGLSRHRAKYLVPNNFQVISGGDKENPLNPSIENANEYEQCYEFGSNTPDQYFRDLYWNKVYTVKNYIPRLQINKRAQTNRFTAIKSVDDSYGSINPFPFNKARFKLNFTYRLLCIISKIIVFIVYYLNKIIGVLGCFHLKKGFLITWENILGFNADLYVPDKDKYLFKFLCEKLVKCISLEGNLFSDDDNTIYSPGCVDQNNKPCTLCIKHSNTETDISKILQTIEQSLAEEYNVINLDFYNDWVNGVLYYPLWFWKKIKKRNYLFGLIKTKGVNRFCNCDTEFKKLKNADLFSISYTNDYNSSFTSRKDNYDKYHKEFQYKETTFGIIKEFVNKLGKSIYYYSPGKPTNKSYSNNISGKTDFVRLYSTDIVLLGGLNDCDLNSLPKPYINLPQTTANVPFMASLIDEDNEDSETIEISGMDWGSKSIFYDINDLFKKQNSKTIYTKGLFLGFTCNVIETHHKTCVNLSRLSELGVSLDSQIFNAVPDKSNTINYNYEIPTDGMITRYELSDNETRAMIASLNHNGFNEKIYDENTGYDFYNLKYKYPVNFDGHMSNYSASLTNDMLVKTYDDRNDEYIKYRFGEINDKTNYLYYVKKHNENYFMPLYNNSFYFYFGLNQGNTSIDKFNKLFFSTCYQKKENPFSLTYKVKTKPWCDEKESAKIEVNLSGIKFPYSYKLYKDTNLIKEENNLFDKSFTITSGKCENKIYMLDNDTYLLTVTDGNGQTMNTDITISPQYLSSNYSFSNLGINYNYNDAEVEEANAFGYVKLTSFEIDGDLYYIRSISDINNNNSTEEDDNRYIIYKKIKLSGNTTYEILTKISIFSQYEKNDYDRFIEINNDNNIINITTTRPCEIQLDHMLLCSTNNKETNNKSYDFINIANGRNFDSFINGVPINIINDKNEFNKIISSSGYTYPLINDEQGFKFYKKNIGLSINSKDDELSLDDKYNIIIYKMNNILNLSKGLIVIDDSNANITVSSEGGTYPIAYRVMYPNYYEFDGKNKITKYLIDSEPYVYCPINGCHFVNNGYTTYKTVGDINLYTKINATENPFVSNYASIGVYTNGGTSPRQTLPSGFTNNNIPTIGIYQWSELGEDVVNKYKKFYFIDQRFDYDLTFTINDYIGSELSATLSGICYGGIKMKYDEEYNIISSGNNLTYQYNLNELTIKKTNHDGSKYYSAYIIENDSNKFNILSCFNGSSFSYELIDKSNLNKLSFYQESCSYFGNLYRDNDTIKCIIQPSNSTKFDIDLKNRFVLNNNELKYSGQTIPYEVDESNLVTLTSGDIISTTSSYTFSVDQLNTNINLNLALDEYNYSHNIITSKPKIEVNSQNLLITSNLDFDSQYKCSNSASTELFGDFSYCYYYNINNNEVFTDKDFKKNNYVYSTNSNIDELFKNSFSIKYATAYLNNNDDNLSKKIVVIVNKEYNKLKSKLDFTFTRYYEIKEHPISPFLSGDTITIKIAELSSLTIQYKHDEDELNIKEILLLSNNSSIIDKFDEYDKIEITTDKLTPYITYTGEYRYVNGLQILLRTNLFDYNVTFNICLDKNQKSVLLDNQIIKISGETSNKFIEVDDSISANTYSISANKADINANKAAISANTDAIKDLTPKTEENPMLPNENENFIE